MFDEMYDGAKTRREYKIIEEWVARQGIEALLTKRDEAESLFRRIGITFAVYGEGGDPDRLIPFDMVPRIFGASEWERIERGSIQRADALNAFLRDIYSDREIIKAGKVPEAMITGNEAYEPVVAGYCPPLGIYSHVVGVDLVRVSADEIYVLEDNCRTPSGISYVLQNREVMSRMFPELFQSNMIRPVDGYGDMLAEAMQAVAPPMCEGEPTLALLTPGHYNSAYFEHSFLADQMGIELVEGGDLFVKDNRVYMRTTQGPERVDVLYRRIDDAFLDPRAFRPDSMLGVPGIIDAMKAGGVTIVNAPGAGVADDKAIYTYVPDMIRFYLGEEPILPNVPTWRCADDEDYKYVMAHLPELVVKEVHGSGGYGMLIGPAATQEEIATYAKRIEADPDGFIAQPTLALSTAPVLTEHGLAPRHVDLRPFVISGKTTRLIPSGLTRVALREGSLVVNSSQGGGVKDTWVLNAEASDA
ncbi:putative circularly permuted ATP-grasp superfamily protein [Rhodovulum bhavnagarense]|uniref:Putative circularly permuted ATP-grasp superfamily protein n=1 Tax=Rhodovulum bhavnagarense TaxID=992286 RepID=A0A4R2RKW7_9RHOB|nr:circularly permuted type 2 ATP-grasp protein [Rhodovulum bhavnagarense]TCP62847.1 putative circularly permuted ATP-grasp superfamily protein [Rhodovulum bhavnagarense]